MLHVVHKFSHESVDDLLRAIEKNAWIAWDFWPGDRLALSNEWSFKGPKQVAYVDRVGKLVAYSKEKADE